MHTPRQQHTQAHTPRHAVIVGTIGTVYEGDSATSARRAFGTYVRASQMHTGRAGGEDVTWLCEGDITQAYIGNNEATEDEDDDHA
jgi:hypothetical protein